MDNKFILLADDNPDSAELFTLALRIKGFDNEVVAVSDGVECLDFLFGREGYAGRDTRTMPSLIVLDLHMPRMDGLQTLERIRADERTRMLPVLMFSATGAGQDMVEAYRLGVNAFIDRLTLSVSYLEMIRQIAHFWLTLNHPPPLVATPK